MRYYDCDVNLVDVPNEISLSFAITGCPLNCKGCFWQALKVSAGKLLDEQTYQQQILRYKSYVSCILFYGGEWHSEALISYLKIARQYNLKTCLYTGLKYIDAKIYQHLDYIKTGAYSEKLGGLNSLTTNQHFYDIRHNVDLTHLFTKIN